MKKIVSPLMLAMALASAGTAMAQTAPAAPESSLSFNVGVVNDYRYRGISQSRLDPALQGGADYADKSGAYIGIWGSSIKWIKDTNYNATVFGKAGTEVDIYGGYKFSVGDVAYDIGFLRYEYSGNDLQKVSGYANANTNELYGAVTLGVVTAKYSRSTGNIFGNVNSKGSTYLDITANFDLGDGYTLAPHLGRQEIKGATGSFYSYTDYAMTLGKDLGNGLSASAAAIGTNAKKDAYTSIYAPGKQMGKAGLVVGIKYAF
jgi:uncharacterized protein (TIGR02001 family)